MPTRDYYVEELAATVNEIFSEGRNDPSAEEIAEAHFPERFLPGEIIESVRKRLSRIRNILEADYGHPVYLLSRTYYSRFRILGPETEEDARRCLPIGQGMKAVGIRRQTDESDLIWQQMVSINVGQAAGKLEKSADRTLQAVVDGRLTAPHARRILERCRVYGDPEAKELADRILGELPAAD